MIGFFRPTRKVDLVFFFHASEPGKKIGKASFGDATFP